MKKIKIRFVQRGNPAKDYLIQKKTWLGWKYIGYYQMANCGDSIRYYYCKDAKDKLLEEVLEYHYKVDKRFIEVIEYPTIKHY